MDVDDPDLSESPKKEESHNEWKKSLPENAGDVRDISDQAFWTLSSCKTGRFNSDQYFCQPTHNRC